VLTLPHLRTNASLQLAEQHPVEWGRACLGTELPSTCSIIGWAAIPRDLVLANDNVQDLIKIEKHPMDGQRFRRPRSTACAAYENTLFLG